MSDLTRALPGRAIDRVRDGVRPKDLASGGDRAVWRELISVCVSAQLRGWSVFEIQSLVADDPRSNLGRQLRVRSDGKPRSPRQVQRQLDDAWERAWEWRTSQPGTLTREEVASEAARRADALTGLAESPDVDLSENQRAVLAYAAEQARHRGLLRVALPLVATAEQLGISEKAVRCALPALERKGLLTLAVRGQRAKSPRNRRASLYELEADPPMCRGTRPIRPSGHTYAPPAAKGPYTPLVSTGRNLRSEP